MLRAAKNGTQEDLGPLSQPSNLATAILGWVFLGSEAISAVQHVWWPKLGFRFHLKRPDPSILSPCRLPGVPTQPLPSIAPAEASRELLKSREFQSERSLRDSSLLPSGGRDCRPAGQQGSEMGEGSRLDPTLAAIAAFPLLWDCRGITGTPNLPSFLRCAVNNLRDTIVRVLKHTPTRTRKSKTSALPSPSFFHLPIKIQLFFFHLLLLKGCFANDIYLIFFPS